MRDRQRDTGEMAMSALPDEWFLKLFRETEVPVLTVQEVARDMEISRRVVSRRLHRLEEQGALERMGVGIFTTVWWLAEE